MRKLLQKLVFILLLFATFFIHFQTPQALGQYKRSTFYSYRPTYSRPLYTPPRPSYSSPYNRPSYSTYQYNRPNTPYQRSSAYQTLQPSRTSSSAAKGSFYSRPSNLIPVSAYRNQSRYGTANNRPSNLIPLNKTSSLQPLKTGFSRSGSLIPLNRTSSFNRSNASNGKYGNLIPLSGKPLPGQLSSSYAFKLASQQRPNLTKLTPVQRRQVQTLQTQIRQKQWNARQAASKEASDLSMQQKVIGTEKSILNNRLQREQSARSTNLTRQSLMAERLRVARGGQPTNSENHTASETDQKSQESQATPSNQTRENSIASQLRTARQRRFITPSEQYVEQRTGGVSTYPQNPVLLKDSVEAIGSAEQQNAKADQTRESQIVQKLPESSSNNSARIYHSNSSIPTVIFPDPNSINTEVTKKYKQIYARNWGKEEIIRTIETPYTTRKSLSKTGNSATVFYTKEGHYVVVDDVTKEMVQVSDRNKPASEWQPDHRIINPYKPWENNDR